METRDRLLFHLLLAIFILLGGCNTGNMPGNTLLELVKPDESGVDFKNIVTEDLQNNVFTYTNFYNGGGVAVGDVDNDGYVDIYLSANHLTGKLYRNKGNFRFDDITAGSGMDTIPGWKTGVTMVDINQDGLLDIYICRSGKARPKHRANLLYVNNGDLTFTEQANKYGLDDWGTSNQATFFDYDLDGDLDMFLLNHAIEPVRKIFKNFHDEDINRTSGDKLFKNENGKYSEIQEFIGINRSKLGAGLGVAVADLNNDLYPDIYVCNDFAGRDYLYFNNGDGTFREMALQAMEHISYSSMGNDAADIDNDGWQDLLTLDMRSSTNYGRKTNMASVNDEAFNLLIDLNGHRQYMRNTLQLNNGNNTFSDIAPLAGITSTDWSWSPLFVDLDNDGYKDLFVSNGMRKNTNNKDYIAYKELRISAETKKEHPDFETMIWDILDKLATEKVVNPVFRNNDGIVFEKYNEHWGVIEPSYSNGAAYADLDNDGDMDFVFNNLDQEAHIYKNNAVQSNGNHYIKVILQGSAPNLNGIGARVMVQAGNNKQYLEQQVCRGYQSSVDFVMNFGLGQSTSIDLLKVTWPDGKVTELRNISVDQLITVDHKSAEFSRPSEADQEFLFSDVTSSSKINHKHEENSFDDFKREALLPHKLSMLGPALAVADINKDGLDDFFVGGASGYEGTLYLQRTDKSFYKSSQVDISADKLHEDVDAHFFDVDGDGDEDLYVVSGGNEYDDGDAYYQDRLYLNDGKGALSKSPNVLPALKSSGSVVRAEDFDQDGDLDLFIGGRLHPGKYPHSSRSYLLQNENGRFIDATSKHAEELANPGMVTDALWSDYNSDGSKDLLLVGEWMPITVFANRKGVLTKVEGDSTIQNSSGWWFAIAESDINKDGKMDYILGNLGENYRYKATSSSPIKLFSNDFDNNGSLDIVLGYYENDTLYPVRGKECAVKQIPNLNQKFENFDSFGTASLEEIYGAEKLQSSDLFEANTLSSMLLLNTGNGFMKQTLPELAQISAVFGIVSYDFDSDGSKDIVLAGNLFNSEIVTPRNDAGQGLYLKGDGKGNFVPVRGYHSGLFIPGDVKKMKRIKLGNEQSEDGITDGVIVAKNNDYVQLVAVQ